jgi:hypothetical protein
MLIPFIQEGIRCTMITRQPIGGTKWREMLLSMLPFATSAREKAEHEWPIGLLQPLCVPERKWKEIVMDFIVGLPRTQSRYDSLWVIVDRLTKVAHFIPVKTIYTRSQVAWLYSSRIVCFHGVPMRIASDRETQFILKFWDRLYETMDTHLNFSSTYHPRTDE